MEIIRLFLPSIEKLYLEIFFIRLLMMYSMVVHIIVWWTMTGLALKKKRCVLLFIKTVY
jgi:hypothetical protein